MPEEAFPQHGPLSHVLHQEGKNKTTSGHNMSHASSRDMGLHGIVGDLAPSFPAGSAE